MKQPEINILEIPFTTRNQSEILTLIADILKQPAKQFFLATPNPEMLLAAQKNPKFRKILQHTNLNIPDGNGIIWANIYQNFTTKNSFKPTLYFKGLISYIAFLFHQKNENKLFNKAIHGSDLMKAICENPQLNHHSIFLLGNEHGLKKNISGTTARILRQNNSQINIAGHFDGSPNNPHNLEKIIAAAPEIIFVAFGSPQQEIWLAENLSLLPSVKLAIGVGGTFDFISGIIPRAPAIMRRMGLEWLYRLYKQPRRLGRIINAAIVFPLKVIANRSNQSPEKSKTRPNHQ